MIQIIIFFIKIKILAYLLMISIEKINTIFFILFINFTYTIKNRKKYDIKITHNVETYIIEFEKIFYV